MRVLQKRGVLWAWLVTILVISLLPGSDTNSSILCEIGDCVVRASLSPLVLISSILSLGIIFGVGAPSGSPAESGRIKKRNVVIAYFIDFFLIMSALVPIAAAIPLILESTYTGQLIGSFERDYLRATDWLAGLTIPLTLAATAVYFGRVGLGKSPTVGQYLLRFRVQPDLSVPAWQRMLGGIVLPLLQPLRPIESQTIERRVPPSTFSGIELERID